MIRVVVNIEIEGLHKWENCPFEDVAFLRDKHRHNFRIRCEKKVSHEDRDIEIILLKRKIISYLTNKYGTPAQFGGMSCESIAVELLKNFDLKVCEVLEDGENGAIVEIS